MIMSIVGYPACRRLRCFDKGSRQSVKAQAAFGRFWRRKTAAANQVQGKTFLFSLLTVFFAAAFTADCARIFLRSRQFSRKVLDPEQGIGVATSGNISCDFRE
jgi:hypothetical protein